MLIVAGFAIWVGIIVRRSSRLARASDMRIHTNLQSAVAEAIAVPEANAAPKLIAVPELVEAATAETPTTSDVEARLAKLGDLHSRGVISDEELAAARLKILAE